jgi:hypothetical protein
MRIRIHGCRACSQSFTIARKPALQCKGRLPEPISVPGANQQSTFPTQQFKARRANRQSTTNRAPARWCEVGRRRFPSERGFLRILDKGRELTQLSLRPETPDHSVNSEFIEKLFVSIINVPSSRFQGSCSPLQMNLELLNQRFHARPQSPPSMAALSGIYTVISVTSSKLSIYQWNPVPPEH